MLTTFNITQQGEYHITRGIPCQDYSKTIRIHPESLDADLVITAVSDGVGSCLYSQDGSRESVEAAVKYIIDGLNAENAVIKDEFIIDLLQGSFDTAYDQVLIYADEHEYSFAQMDCTLTISVFDGEKVWFGHVGDDGIVAMYTDGTYEMITTRHKGEYASSVFPLRDTTKWQFGKTEKPVASIALMTDGALDYVVGSEFYDNRIFYPFIQPILADPMDSDEKMEQLKQDFEVYLKDDPKDPSGYRKKVTDDITLAVVQNSDAVGKLPEITFDMEQWDKDTEEYNKKAETYLYRELHAKSGESEKQKKGSKPLVVETDDGGDSDGLDILTQKQVDDIVDSVLEGVPEVAPETEDNGAEVREAADQLLNDVVEASNAAGKGILKLVKSAKKLGSAIYNSMKDGEEEEKN